MPVGRLSLPEGISLGEGPITTQEQVLTAAYPHLSRLALMGAGLTSVTPEAWDHNLMEYVMEVDDNGDGTLHMVPRKAHEPPLIITSAESSLRGIDVQHINILQAGAVPLVGDHPSRPGLHLWELFTYIPPALAVDFNAPHR
jgi:hypothetical protein